jgi:hypothetical protein
MIITDGILRMRNRNGVDQWEFMEPGEIYEIEVDLWSSSYIWNTGHRIRVAVSSSNYPRFLANPNTKDSVLNNDSYNIASNTLYIDSQHPSCIILPEIEPGPTSTPPVNPKRPSGPRLIKTDKLYKYIATSTDPENDQIYVLFDWDDGISSGWLGPYNSGEKVIAYHKWSSGGTFEIKVKVKDVDGAQSEWSEPLKVVNPQSRTFNNNILLRLIDRFPILYIIFRAISRIR